MDETTRFVTWSGEVSYAHGHPVMDTLSKRLSVGAFLWEQKCSNNIFKGIDTGIVFELDKLVNLNEEDVNTDPFSENQEPCVEF